MAVRALRVRPLVLLGGLLILYLAWPLIGFVVRLAQNAHPGFTTPGLFGALATSAVAATIATALIALFGIPLAYVLARSRGRLASFVGFLVTLPLALPPLMSGILLIYVVGPYTALGTFFGRTLTDSLAGIVLAQTFVAAPFLVIIARASFAAIDPALFDLAAGLGRGELARFLRVAVPVAGGGLRAGLLLAWLRAFGEFGATVILAFHPYSLPVYTYLQFSSTGLSTTEAPTAVALALAALVVAASGLRARPRRRRIRLPSPAPPPAVAGEAIAFDLDLRLGDFHLAADMPPRERSWRSSARPVRARRPRCARSRACSARRPGPSVTAPAAWSRSRPSGARSATYPRVRDCSRTYGLAPAHLWRRRRA